LAIFASCISSEPRAARFRHASQIRTKATLCVEVWQTSNLRPLRLGEEKKERKERKGRKSIYIAPFRTKVHTKRSGMDHTVLPANNTMPANKRQDENIYGLPYYIGRP